MKSSIGKNLLASLLGLSIMMSGCAKHQFSELQNSAAVAQPTPPEPEEPEVVTPPPVIVEPPPVIVEPPPVVVPKAPSILWLQVPASTLNTGDAVKATYSVVEGSSPVVDIECIYDGKEIPCAIKGQTLNFASTEAGLHHLQITVKDKNNLQDSDGITWSLFEKFQKVETPLKIAKEDALVDIVFIIDNSNSMREEQSNMAQRITSFMEKVDGLDWRLAIISTDVVDAVKGDGRFLKFPNGQYFLTSALSLAQAKEQFGKTIQTGVNGSASEQGIKSMYRSIERAVSPKEKLDQQNVAFFRKDAALNVIVISDENESGIGPKNHGSELIKLVQSTWGVEKLFKFHSIITRPGDKTCNAKIDQSEGKAYAELTELTKGVLGNVCAADYGTQLTVIGQDVLNTQTTYDLDCEPRDANNDGIADVKVSSTSGAKAPSFITDGKKIIFSAAPAVGSYVIDYFCPKN